MTDTTADLPESYIREHKLQILSLSYMMEETTYDREHPLDVKEFYRKMRDGSMPVSYTHLDVYKRQISSRYSMASTLEWR